MNRTPAARSRISSSASREPTRTRNAGRREPLADQVPRPVKRTAGRAPAPLTPANIRVDGVRLNVEDRAYIRRRLGEKLGKYSSSIERVTVRVRDVNGPRGGIDLLCRIKVVLSEPSERGRRASGCPPQTCAHPRPHWSGADRAANGAAQTHAPHQVGGRPRSRTGSRTPNAGRSSDPTSRSRYASRRPDAEECQGDCPEATVAELRAGNGGSRGCRAFQS